jgi:hypothetical protein
MDRGSTERNEIHTQQLRRACVLRDKLSDRGNLHREEYSARHCEKNDARRGQSFIGGLNCDERAFDGSIAAP